MVVELNAWVPVVGTLGGAFLGGTASFIGSIVGQWMTSKREREARVDEADAERRRQWQEFQGRTLMDLQVALDRTVRISFRTADLAGKAAQGMTPMDQAIRAEAAYHAARNRALILASRVEEVSAREGARALCDLAEGIKTVGVSFAVHKEYDVDRLSTRYAAARRKFVEVNDLIGEVLRLAHRPPAAPQPSADRRRSGV